MIWVTRAEVLPGYRLRLRFSDGVEGGVDSKEFIESDARAIGAALRDPPVFAALRVERDTVVWENGFDLAPEFLRERAKPVITA